MITADQLKAALGIPPADSADDAWAAQVVAAVNEYVAGLPWVADHADAPAWPEQAITGALLLAMRTYSARSAPLGMATLDAAGSLQVAQTDPEVGRLLRLGRYTQPGVG